MREHKRLFAAFTAFVCFQTSYLRLSFMTMERAGLLEYESLIFILYCAAIFLGMLLAPPLLDKALPSASPGRLTVIVRCCLSGCAVFAVAGYFSGGFPALALHFFTVLVYASALAVVVRTASGSIEARCAGVLYGLSGAVMHAVSMAPFYQPFIAIPAGAVLAILCCFLAIAGFCFKAGPPRTAPSDDASPPFVNYVPLERRIIRLAVLALGLFVIFGGLMDNIFYFDAAFTYIPNFHFYLFIYNIFIYAAAGLLFERVDPAIGAICAFALIAASQSMVFFSMYDFLAYPYALLSNMGYIAMEVYLCALPIAYIAHTRRKPGILPGLGFIMLNGSFFVMSVMFEFIPPAFYRPALGVMLLIAIAAILVTSHLLNVNKLHRLAMLQEELRRLEDRQALHDQHDEAGLVEPLTGREKDVMRYLVEGKSNKDIADSMGISVNTVKYHVANIYGKYMVNSRAELIGALLRQKMTADL